MTRRECLQERYEDALFALLMEDFAVAEGEKALEECERLHSDEEAAVSDKAMRRGLQTIRRRFARQSAGKAVRKTAKFISGVAVVVLVGMMTFTAALAVSETFRINTLNYMVEWFDDHAVFDVNTTMSTLPEDVTAGWLPEGYQFTDRKIHATVVEFFFQTTTGEKFRVSVHDGDLKMAVDTEDAEVGTIMIDEYEAVTIVKQGLDGYGNPYTRSRVIWFDRARWCYIDVLSNDENIETLIQVAKQLSFE